MIAFIVRVHDAAEGLAGLVEFPGSGRTPFRSSDELIELMTTWLGDTSADPALSDPTGDR